MTAEHTWFEAWIDDEATGREIAAIRRRLPEARPSEAVMIALLHDLFIELTFHAPQDETEEPWQRD